MAPTVPTRIVEHRRALAVVPNDALDFGVTRALYVGVTGNVRVNMANGQDITFVGAQAGSVLPIGVTRIWATNTTATNIIRFH